MSGHVGFGDKHPWGRWGVCGIRWDNWERVSVDLAKEGSSPLLSVHSIETSDIDEKVVFDNKPGGMTWALCNGHGRSRRSCLARQLQYDGEWWTNGWVVLCRHLVYVPLNDVVGESDS